jgi:hypothetical protein
MFKGPTICPKCGGVLELALPSGGKDQRFSQYFNCDRPDPLKSDQMKGWLKCELGREQ